MASGTEVGADENSKPALRLVEPGARTPTLGELVRLVPGHCDPTVNLYDWLVVTRNQRVEAVWPVTARGCVN